MDLRFKTQEGWFTYRVGAIILEDGCVLMAKNDRDPYCYSVGGGVHLGESAEEAVVREAYEETGVRYEIDRLAYIHENFFRDAEAMAYHEISLYFLMKPKGVKTFSAESYVLNGVRERMVWLPVDHFSSYHAYPTFFGEKLRNMGTEVEHIVTRE